MSRVIRYAIIGNSAAGLAAARAIRTRDREGRITLFSEEPFPFYSRLLLTYFLKGTISREEMLRDGGDFHKTRSFEVKINTRLEGILAGESKIVSSAGENFLYDRLLVAAGSSPVVPPISGIRLPGVFPLRTLSQAEGVRSRIKQGGEAVVLGGGLVGLQTAQALHFRGMKTTLIVSSDLLLSRNLDGKGSDLLLTEAKELGLEVFFRKEAAEIGKGPRGRLRVVLQGGEVLKADLVILAKGVEARTELLKGAGAAVREGVLVNQRLRTGLDNIFAAGDVAELTPVPGRVGGIFPIWPHAIEQGGIAGLNMTGLDVPFQGGIPMNITELFGMKIASIGRVKNDGSLEEIMDYRPQEKIYRKILFREEAIAGALLMGDVADCGILQRLIRSRKPVPRSLPKILNHGAAITHRVQEKRWAGSTLPV
jgi:NAD(P)H-nitrite reductase large subunit